MDENMRTLAHIEGLLEAWCHRGESFDWQAELDQLTNSQRMRIREMFGLLRPEFIVRMMDCGMESDKKLLITLAQHLYG